MTAQLLLQRLEELTEAIAATGATVSGNLAPGIEEAGLREKLRPLGMEPPMELITWYGWHNGLIDQQVASGRSWLPLFEPLSIDAALADRQQQLSGADPEPFPPTWLPILRAMGPNRLTVNCTPPAGMECPVRQYTPEADPEEFPTHPSLTVAVEQWIRSLREGWIRYLPSDDRWDIDFLRMPLEIRTSGLM